eukprot:g36839.t1
MVSLSTTFSQIRLAAPGNGTGDIRPSVFLVLRIATRNGPFQNGGFNGGYIILSSLITGQEGEANLPYRSVCFVIEVQF